MNTFVQVCTLNALYIFSQLLDAPLSYSVATVSFSPQNYTVSEGTSVELIIVLDRPACQDISVTVTTMDGTAVGECLY